MKSKLESLKRTRESDLLKARQSGLQQARSLDTMQAHGKWNGKDTFSWVSPNLDTLANTMATFPFPVIWVGRHEQIKCAGVYYPEVLEAIEAAIVYDQANITWKDGVLNGIDKIAGVGDITSALALVRAIEQERGVFLFTTEEAYAEEDLDRFHELIGR